MWLIYLCNYVYQSAPSALTSSTAPWCAWGRTTSRSRTRGPGAPSTGTAWARAPRPATPPRCPRPRRSPLPSATSPPPSSTPTARSTRACGAACRTAFLMLLVSGVLFLVFFFFFFLLLLFFLSSLLRGEGVWNGVGRGLVPAPNVS